VRLTCPLCGSEERQEAVRRRDHWSMPPDRRCTYCGVLWRPGTAKIDAFFKAVSGAVIGMALLSAAYALLAGVLGADGGLWARASRLGASALILGVLREMLHDVWYGAQVLAGKAGAIEVLKNPAEPQVQSVPPTPDTRCQICKMGMTSDEVFRCCANCAAVVHEKCWSSFCPRCRGEMK